jgi:hypothetical protein
MLASSKPKSLSYRRFAPHANDIFMRTNLDRIPSGVFGVPQIEIIVVYAHSYEISGAARL